MIGFNPDLPFLLLGMTCSLAGGSRRDQENLDFLMALTVTAYYLCQADGWAGWVDLPRHAVKICARQAVGRCG